MAIAKRHIEKFNELRQFFLQNGHCYVPSNKEYVDLYEWVQNIKLSRLRLEAALIAELESMGFDWTIYSGSDSIWLGRYYALKKFKEKYGHLKVLAKKGDYIKLGRWVWWQRLNEKKLSPNRKKLLNEIGFLWSSYFQREKEERWMKNYKALVQFKKQYGHTRPKKGQVPFKLIGWIAHQRRLAGKQPQEQKQKLESIGFLWDTDIKRLKEAEWQNYYKQLVTFKKKNGHCQVTETNAEKDFFYWVIQLRSKEKTLPKTKKQLLDDLGFLWRNNYFDNSWQKSYQELKKYYKEHGHCKVPNRYPPNPSLGAWVSQQRVIGNRMDAKRKQLLDAINFHWEPLKVLQKNWADRFERLKKFYQKYGHSKIPYRWQEDKELAQWVWYLIKSEQVISNEWRERLKEVDFKWIADIKKANKDAWMVKYNQLKAFHEKHGHYRVTKAESSKQFVMWVCILRHKKHKQPEWRMKLLHEINFNWESQPYKKKYWADRYAELLAFYKEHGHIKIPSTKTYEQLRKWVYQLKNRKLRLSREQLVQLEVVKFEW